MSGDIAFEPTFQRTISCDIRFVLLMIDKYANAQNLINEMKLVQTMPEPPPVPVSVIEEKMAPVMTEPIKKPIMPKGKMGVKKPSAVKS